MGLETIVQLVAEIAAHLHDGGSEAALEQGERGAALRAAWDGFVRADKRGEELLPGAEQAADCLK